VLKVKTYIAVRECRYCRVPIPLTEYDSEAIYKLADRFAARHSACRGLGIHSFSDLDKLELAPPGGLIPQLEFAERVLPR